LWKKDQKIAAQTLYSARILYFLEEHLACGAPIADFKTPTILFAAPTITKN
jgi:hypothetical protein